MTMMLQLTLLVVLVAIVGQRTVTAAPIAVNAITCTTDLQLLFIGFRHGARVTTTFFPNDENNAKWTVGVGQLTPQGMLMHYKNGYLVHNKYAPLFDRYDPSKLSARSSPVDRTLMSGSAFLASLITPKGNQIFLKRFNWQPAALYSEPFLEAKVPSQILDQVSTAAMPSIIAKDPNTVNTLEKASGINALGNGLTFFTLLDNLVTEYFAGFNLPFGLNNKLEPKIQYLKDQLFMAMFSDHDVRCHLAPQILDDFVTKTNSRLQNKTSKFIYIWSMHDANVFALLSILTDYHSESPPFAATLFFEVRPYNYCRDHEVKLCYRKDVNSPDVELKIIGCDSPCTLDTLEAIVDGIKSDCNFISNTVPDSGH